MSVSWKSVIWISTYWMFYTHLVMLDSNLPVLADEEVLSFWKKISYETFIKTSCKFDSPPYVRSFKSATVTRPLCLVESHTLDAAEKRERSLFTSHIMRLNENIHLYPSSRVSLILELSAMINLRYYHRWLRYNLDTAIASQIILVVWYVL